MQPCILIVLSLSAFEIPLFQDDLNVQEPHLENQRYDVCIGCTSQEIILYL